MNTKKQFVIPATEEALRYLEKIADAIEFIYGLNREEAVRKINTSYVEANERAAKARRSVDVEDSEAIAKVDAFGGSAGLDLTSDLSVALLTHELPEFWARLICTGERSREPMRRRSAE